jgi:hypothetical protein
MITNSSLKQPTNKFAKIEFTPSMRIIHKIVDDSFIKYLELQQQNKFFGQLAETDPN